MHTGAFVNICYFLVHVSTCFKKEVGRGGVEYLTVEELEFYTVRFHAVSQSYLLPFCATGVEGISFRETSLS